ncbi:MAG: purine-nucleoside phosphorylase [Deltaproteobacteria bacterium]|nr:purine-nucleoside phosphorylase [Deltaproteobacteria bacterium]
MLEKIKEAADFLSKTIGAAPIIGMVTGTGLADLAQVMDVDRAISYEDIPHFPKSTVPGHAGMFLSGHLFGKSILAMQGRFHIYEGYSVNEVTLPIRVMALLGVRYLLIFSAAGGLDPHLKPGDLMLVTDHINLTGQNPLIGRNAEDAASRFADMSSAYDGGLTALAMKAALTNGIHLHQGVYVGITGPSLETPAETRFLRLIGADAVGMSTVNEVIEAVHSGMRVLVIVAITNRNIPECMAPISIEEVLANAKKATPALTRLLGKIIEDLEV